MTLQQVHLRINDAVTGKPTPVRLRISDAAGNYYAPYGRLTEFATGVNQDVGGNVQIGAKKWAYIDGACEILLPEGTLRIEAAKGPEYKPIDETIPFLSGKMTLRLNIERWTDLRKQGWYSGDCRAHFLSPDAALLEGQAEDLAVVNLLARQTTITDSCDKSFPAIPNITAFSGQSFARFADGCGVAVNTHNWHPQLGSLGLLHCHRVVYPLTFDNTEWTLLDWCGQCHRKKGLVVWSAPEHPSEEFRAGEGLADLVLGEIDAFEMTGSEESRYQQVANYYALLDAGFSPTLVGSSGKESNAKQLGELRTYAFLGAEGEFSYSPWIEAVRAGQTFVSNGPLLEFTIDGQVPGREQIAQEGGKALKLRAVCRSVAPFLRLELLWNGTVIGAANAGAGAPFEAVIERDFSGESGHLTIRCRGAVTENAPCPFAHSSAAMIRKEGSPARAAPQTLRLFNMLTKLRHYAEERGHHRLLHVVKDALSTVLKK